MQSVVYDMLHIKYMQYIKGWLPKRIISFISLFQDNTFQQLTLDIV